MALVLPNRGALFVPIEAKAACPASHGALPLLGQHIALVLPAGALSVSVRTWGCRRTWRPGRRKLWLATERAQIRALQDALTVSEAFATRQPGAKHGICTPHDVMAGACRLVGVSC